MESASSEALLTLAEVAVGLVGFTGIVLALTRRDSPVPPGELLQLKELIRGGLAGVGLALLPAGAELAGFSGPGLWRTLSGLHMALIVVGPWVLVTRAIVALPASERDTVLYVCTYGIASAVFAVQLANVVGRPLQPSAGLYYYGVCGTLVTTSIYFGRLLFTRLL